MAKVEKVKLFQLGATGLKAADFGGTSDPYAILRVRGTQIGKTKVIDKTLNPSWKDEFTHEFLTSDVLEVFFYDKDKIGKDDPLGSSIIPMNQIFTQLATADRCNASFQVQQGTGTFYISFEIKRVVLKDKGKDKDKKKDKGKGKDKDKDKDKDKGKVKTVATLNTTVSNTNAPPVVVAPVVVAPTLAKTASSTGSIGSGGAAAKSGSKSTAKKSAKKKKKSTKAKKKKKAVVEETFDEEYNDDDGGDDGGDYGGDGGDDGGDDGGGDDYF